MDVSEFYIAACDRIIQEATNNSWVNLIENDYRNILGGASVTNISKVPYIDKNRGRQYLSINPNRTYSFDTANITNLRFSKQISNDISEDFHKLFDNKSSYKMGTYGLDAFNPLLERIERFADKKNIEDIMYVMVPRGVYHHLKQQNIETAYPRCVLVRDYSRLDDNLTWYAFEPRNIVFVSKFIKTYEPGNDSHYDCFLFNTHCIDPDRVLAINISLYG